MNRTTIRVAWLLALLMPVASAFAFPGRGGGGRGGGGMRGGGGGFSGGGGGMRGGGGGGSFGGGGGMRGGGGNFGGGGGGGGFGHSPSFSSPRPSPRPSPGGGGVGARPAPRPSGPQLGGGGGAARPSVGGGRPPVSPGGSPLGSRPSTLPSGPGAGARPAGGPGAAPGLGSRPGVGQPGVGQPGIANRPGVGQPGVGQTGFANRPGVGQAGLANRPGVENRPAAAGGLGDRAVVGSGNTVNRGDINVSGVRQDNLAAARVDPGYGVRAPVGDAYRGAYGGYHQGWVNGYWHGYHTNPSWNWGSFAVGAATGVTAWGVGSSMYSWGYAPYTNPYYASAGPAVVAQPVAAVEGQPAAAPVAYDYSQPIDTQAPPPEPTVADQATATFDAAREAFKAGDYPRAQALADQALGQLPNDATLHEFRALCLFAQQKFEQAAVPLYAVLSVGPGWDWTTMIGLYPGVDVYTQQLRALEAYTKANPKSPAAPFVLAYHYLTQDHADAAVKQLRQVVALSPADTLSAQLINQLTGGTAEAAAAPPAQPAAAPAPAPPPDAAPVAPGNLAGSWSASPAPDTTIGLTIQDGGAFAWKVSSKGKAQDITGDWSLTNGVLTLARSGQGGAMVGNVTWLAPDRFTFRALGTGPDDSGLTFSR